MNRIDESYNQSISFSFEMVIVLSVYSSWTLLYLGMRKCVLILYWPFFLLQQLIPPWEFCQNYKSSEPLPFCFRGSYKSRPAWTRGSAQPPPWAILPRIMSSSSSYPQRATQRLQCSLGSSDLFALKHQLITHLPLFSQQFYF